MNCINRGLEVQNPGLKCRCSRYFLTFLASFFPLAAAAVPLVALPLRLWRLHLRARRSLRLRLRLSLRLGLMLNLRLGLRRRRAEGRRFAMFALLPLIALFPLLHAFPLLAPALFGAALLAAILALAELRAGLWRGLRRLG